MYVENNLTLKQIEDYLKEVDDSFPIPLSQKQDLSAFAEKLFEKATICAEIVDGRIVSALAGYTDNVIENRGYMSIAASVKGYLGKGHMTKLIKQFLAIAAEKHLGAVHLYAVPTNTTAVALFKKIGFVEWQIPDEPRPEDMHLIYYFSEKSAEDTK